MGKKREHMTVEEIKAFVEAEIPYVVGKGTQCVQNRAKRMKELMRRHGHDLTNAPGMTWGGPLASSGVGAPDNRQTGKPEGGTTNTEDRYPMKALQGQRVA